MINFLRKKINTKFWFISKYIKTENEFMILDVGAGNRSASKTTSVFPNARYYGLDLNKETDYIDEDFKRMSGFYELDLTKLDFDIIPNNSFDYINMAHVIEHLYNGDKVLPLLTKKLKNGGYFYIEYPAKKSTHLPSMYGTLNFYDDPTHVRLYEVNEIIEIFESNGCRVIKSGVRRNLYYIFLMPFRIIWSILTIGKLRGNIFWDIAGFAEFVFVQKN